MGPTGASHRNVEGGPTTSTGSPQQSTWLDIGMLSPKDPGPESHLLTRVTSRSPGTVQEEAF